MARRMSRLRLLFLVAALPLALWLVVPVLSDGAPLSEQDRGEEARDRAQEGPRARAHDDDHGLHAADQPARRATSRRPRRRARCGSRPTSPTKRAELARVQDELRRERIRLARLRARLAEARAALSRPARRALQGRRARRRHGDPRVRRLRRPARAHRVHAARLASRTRASSTASREAKDGGRRGREAARRARGAAAQGHRRGRAARRARSTRSRTASSSASRRSRACARTRRRRSSPRARDRHELEGDLAALEKEQAQVAGAGSRGSACRAGPIRQGSGTLDLAGQRPVPSPFGMRWGRLHAGVDIAVAGGHADPRRRLRPRRAARLDRRLRQLHLHRARRLALDLLRAPVALRDVDGRERQPGPGDRLRRQHRPLASATTCTSRCASTGRRSTRWATSSARTCSRCSRRSTSAR